MGAKGKNNGAQGYSPVAPLFLPPPVLTRRNATRVVCGERRGVWGGLYNHPTPLFVIKPTPHCHPDAFVINLTPQRYGKLNYTPLSPSGNGN